MSEILPPLVYQFGVGGILGFITGYALKKMAKIFLVVLGFFTIVLLYLEYIGIISVNYDKLAEAVSGFTKTFGQSSEWITPILAHMPFAGSFAVGLAIGLKVG